MIRLVEIYKSLKESGLEQLVDELDSMYPRVHGGMLDGLTVHDDVPNTASIGATYTNYDELDGIRSIPIDEFDADPKSLFYAKGDIDRVYRLAEEIEENGYIKPLIVVFEPKEEPYVLEGGHRLGALFVLNKPNVPALIIAAD